MANPLDARWQDMQHEAAYELIAWQSDAALSPFLISAHRQHHLMFCDRYNPLVGNRRAMGVRQHVKIT